MSVNTEAIKLKSWAKKAEYLQSLLSDHHDILVIYERDFNRALRIAVGNIRVTQDKNELQKNIDAATSHKKTLKEIEKETEVKPGEKDPKRSLYRKIAFQTHPDRQGLLNSDDATKEKNEELFKRAKNSFEEEDLVGLLVIANSIGLNPLEMGMTIKEIRKIYVDLEKSIAKEIQKIESTYVWVWGESYGNINMRINLLDAYLRQTGHPPVEKSILRDIIDHHESAASETDPASRQRKVGKRPKKLLR